MYKLCLTSNVVITAWLSALIIHLFIIKYISDVLAGNKKNLCKTPR